MKAHTGGRTRVSQRELARAGFERLPVVVARAGPRAARRCVEFFTAGIGNGNTRAAYARAVGRFFDWCEGRRLKLGDIRPAAIAAYLERHPGSRPTVRQHLAAIRMLLDWLVTGGVLPMNPAASVRGPKSGARGGRTPVLTARQARTLLDSIDTGTIVGLRDRALIGVMCYGFARVGSTVAMRVEDHYQKGKLGWFRLREKSGRRHEVPAHHKAGAYVRAYVRAAGIAGAKKEPLFRSISRHRRLTGRAMSRSDVLRMIKRRAKAAGLPRSTCCHTFRATGITAYLENGGNLEDAQSLAAHISPRTTRRYACPEDTVTQDEVERIDI